MYSNDSRGWKILGAAHALCGEYEEAYAAATNSVRLGDKGLPGPDDVLCTETR